MAENEKEDEELRTRGGFSTHVERRNDEDEEEETEKSRKKINVRKR